MCYNQFARIWHRIVSWYWILDASWYMYNSNHRNVDLTNCYNFCWPSTIRSANDYTVQAHYILPESQS